MFYHGEEHVHKRRTNLKRDAPELCEIPKSVRDRLDLQAGDQLDFVVGDDGTVTLRRRSLRVDDVYGVFADRVERPVAVAEMDEAIARDRARRR